MGPHQSLAMVFGAFGSLALMLGLLFVHLAIQAALDARRYQSRSMAFNALGAGACGLILVGLGAVVALIAVALLFATPETVTA